MATYALDVTKQRVKQAMEAEGIIDSELLLKTLADFAGPHVAPDIQQLRWEFFRKKLHATVKLIKQRIRRQNEAPQQKNSVQAKHHAATPSLHLKQAQPRTPNPVVVVTPPPTVPKSFSTPTLVEVAHRIEIAEGLKTEIRKDQEEARGKKKEHERMVKELEHTQAQLQKDLIRNLAGTAARERRVMESRQIERAKSQTARSYTFRPQTDRAETVTSQLSRIEARIEANRQLHLEVLKAKSLKAARTTAKALQYASQLSSLRETMEEQRLMDYIKQQKLETRQKSVSSQSPTRHQPRTAPVTMRAPHDCILSNSQQETNFALRMEEQRLKDEEKRLKVTRERRKFVRTIQDRKRSHWLSKLLDACQRADGRRHELTVRLAKQHDTSIPMMIVKKQGEELRQQVLHTPTSKSLLDKLRSLAILPPPAPAPQ